MELKGRGPGPSRGAALSRRELCAAMLGSAWAAALSSGSGCARKAARAPVPGAIVDQVHAAGHLLRATPTGFPASAHPEPVDVLIVGGGIAGLSAAWRLRGAGVSSFVLCELDREPGGNARSGRGEAGPFPWGAHYLVAPLLDQGPVVRLLRELGAVTSVDEHGRPSFDEALLVHEPEERLYFRGRWYGGLYPRAGASAEELAELDRFEAQMAAYAALRDAKGRKAFAVPFAASSDDAELVSLDRIPFPEWLAAQGYRSPRLRWWLDYACRDEFGSRLEQVSAWAGLWYFCARQGGLEQKNAGYLAWPQGNGRLAEHLASQVGREHLRPGLLVHTVKPTRDGVMVQAMDATSRAPQTFLARQVVFAAPRFVAARTVEPWRRERPSFFDAFDYAPWTVANLTVRRPPDARGHPLAWDNVLYDSKSLGYVVSTHQSSAAREVAPAVLTWYYPFTGDDARKDRQDMLSLRYEDWESLVMSDLTPAHFDLAQVAVRLEVQRWGHAMARPRPGFLWGAARAQAQESVGERGGPANLHFAHSDLGLPVFEEACHQGVRAAERCLAALGKSPASWT